MNEKTKQKQEKIIEMVSSFCKDNLNEEYGQLSINLVEKMGRKQDVPFKRGRLDIWASAVIYALAQINFLFDKNHEHHISASDICDYFNTKKSTVSSKAAIISDMFNLIPLTGEFFLKYEPDDFKDINSTSDLDSFFNEIYRLHSIGETEKAIKKLDIIPKNHSEYPRALFYKSVFLNSIGDSRANNLFVEAIMDEIVNARGEDFIDDEDYEDYFNRGLDEYQSGNFEEALHLFNISISLNSNQSEALYYKAVTLGRLGEFEEALDFVNRAIKLNSKEDRYWNDKANFLSRLGNNNEAIKCFDKAIELNPTDSILWANKGFLYRKNEKYNKALESYDKACQIDPLNIHNILGKANVYIEIEDFGRAKKYLKKASKLDKNDLEYLTAMAYYMWGQNKFKSAIRYWDKCIEIDEQAMFWVHKAMLYYDLNDEFNFRKCLEKARDLEPFIMDIINESIDE